MQFIKNSFADKVRSGRIKSPLRKDFSIEKWNNSTKSTIFDENLHRIGLYFYEQFSTIRDHLSQLPKILSREDYLKIFVGMANRDLKVLTEHLNNSITDENHPVFDINFHAIHASNNPLGNSFSINEIAINMIDGIHYNILSHLQDSSETPINRYSNSQTLKLIRTENLLSQLYNAYEQYWNSILYEQIDYELIDNVLTLKENSAFMEAFHIHDIRKSRIRSNEIIVGYEQLKSSINDFVYLISDGKEIGYLEFKKLHPKHQNSIISCINSFNDETINFIPADLPNFSFNINDLIRTFIQLCSLSHCLIEALDSDTSINNCEYSKFKNFNKKFNSIYLANHLSLVTATPVDTVLKILDFLTFTDKSNLKPKTDLWRFPIVRLNKDEILFVITPLLNPVGLRCFEGWMARADVNIAQKGASYENHIKQTLKNIFSENNLIEHYNLLEIENISINGNSEEIDLIFKIGNLVVLGEAKCVVTTDSANSFWNSTTTIKNASEQALRKLDFISKNFEIFCKRFNWDYDTNIKYQFCPIVVISSGFGAGYSFFNVPVIDHKILFSYFEKAKLPLISTEEGDDLAYLTLYKSSHELIKNFYNFVYKPPTIETYKLCLKPLPSIKLLSCKDRYEERIHHIRLGVSELNKEEILAHDYGFELVKLESLDSYLANV